MYLHDVTPELLPATPSKVKDKLSLLRCIHNRTGG
jgi:hypothetical protein